jgi:adenylosuccinate synthase
VKVVDMARYRRKLEHCVKVVDMARYRRKHGRLDTRILRHAALVNGESSCGLTLVEMFTSGNG